VLAVVRFVLAALCAAGFTDFRADATKLVRELRSAAHKGRRAPASLSTVAVQADTLRHLGHVPFLKARTGTVLALLGTRDAGFNTGTKFVMSHNLPLLVQAVFSHWA
jgi:hypothetical protein